MPTTAATTVFATSEGGGDSGSFLVSPDVGLMIWTLIVFGLSMYVLAKLAFPRIAEALDKRQRAIEDSIDTAERTRQQADELLAEYRQRLTEARSQADEIVAPARPRGARPRPDETAAPPRRTGERAEAESLAEARRKREELMDQTRREIDQETTRAIAEIRNQVADLTGL